jgi:hypothetical protein
MQVVPRSIEELKALIEAEVPESLHLDYKASPALAKNKPEEIAKDVSAMANADGGTIIYGITEVDHVPTWLDAGVDEASGPSRLWLDQLFLDRITPPIGGIEIIPIKASEGRSYFVISIPRSVVAPHQAPDKKYYKRYNFQSAPMDHYEIQDVSNRRVAEPRLIDIRGEIDAPAHHVNIVIQNIGRKAALDVRFAFPDAFTWPSSGFASGEIPSPLRNGVRYFPSERRVHFSYCGTMDLFNPERKISTEFDVRIGYIPEGSPDRVEEVIPVSFNEYNGTLLERTALDRIEDELHRGLENIARSIHDPVRQMLKRSRPPARPKFKQWRKKKD